MRQGNSSPIRDRNTLRARVLLSASLAILLAMQSDLAVATSLRFYGNGVNDIDRVKIRIDDPALPNDVGPPADVGDTNFTVEFWLKGALADNQSGDVQCGSNNNWITGNIVIDRDRFAQGREYGISVGNGRIAFGTSNANQNETTICGSRAVLDGQWHHVAVQRRRSDGFLWIYVDGVLDGSGDGPDGEISYPDDGVPLNLCGPSQSASCDNSDPFLVFGAEKHDAAGGYPSFNGFLDEVRLSTELRYSGPFTPLSVPFSGSEANTAALYHFDEGSGTIAGDSAPGGASPGVLRVGGSPTGPEWSIDSPFAAGAGTIRLTSSTFTVTENVATGAINITAERVGGTSGAASVSIAVTPGTATSGADYSPPVSQALSWSAGEQGQKSVSIDIINDVEVEPTETVNITLSNASGATLGLPSSAVLSITDNDGVAGSLRFAMSSVSVSEGAGTATINVERTGGSDGIIGVSYATSNGSATAGSDYSARSGTLSWANGDAMAKSFTVPITDDTTFEGNETVNLTLTSPTGGASLGTPSTAVLTITENDVAPAGSLQFSMASYSIAESGAMVTITATRTGGTNGAVSVSYATSNGTATAGSDYTTASGTLSWPSGQSGSRTFSVPILDDVADESNETVNVALSAPTGGATLGTPSTAVLTISDNDTVAAGSLQFSATGYSATEASGSVTITATRNGGSSGAVSVGYATSNGSASAGSDFTGTSGTLSWTDGETGPKSFAVSITDDTSDEGDETVGLLLSAPTGGASLGSPDTATLTIADNDSSTGNSTESGGGSVGWWSLLGLALAAMRRRFRLTAAPPAI
jgi:hypothetical protein